MAVPLRKRRLYPKLNHFRTYNIQFLNQHIIEEYFEE